MSEKNNGGSQEPPSSEKAIEKPPKNKAVQPKENKVFGIKDFYKMTRPETEESKEDEDEFSEIP